MSTAVRYLEQAKIEALTEQQRQQGYSVAVPSGGRYDYDLVATKGDQRIAFKVVALSSLSQERKRINDLRRRAFDEGFSDFRLVVVSPPRQTAVSIPGLERQLGEYLRDHQPRELQSLASSVRIESVSNLEITSISLNEAGVDVAGTGVLEVTLEYGESRDGLQNADDFPLHFRVLLSQDRHLVEVNELIVDVSSYSDYS